MGTNRQENISLGEALFSKTQRQILGLLFGHPDQTFYAKEIVRFAGVGIGSVQRELERLSSVGLLHVRMIGNQKHYQANKQSPIYDELRGIVLKTFGVADVLMQALEPVRSEIHAAFIYGSVAKGTDKAGSDIDLLIISESLTYARLFSLLNEAETKLARTVNLTLYNQQEINERIAADNSFVTRVLDQPKIFLTGNEHGIAST